jgi:hypothetical protein
LEVKGLTLYLGVHGSKLTNDIMVVNGGMLLDIRSFPRPLKLGSHLGTPKPLI